MEEHDTNQGETAEGSAAHRESMRLGEVVDAVGELVAKYGVADVLWALAQVADDTGWECPMLPEAALEEARAMARRWRIFDTLIHVADASPRALWNVARVLATRADGAL